MEWVTFDIKSKGGSYTMATVNATRADAVRSILGLLMAGQPFELRDVSDKPTPYEELAR